MNKKIIGLGVLAALFFMNNKEAAPSGGGSSGGSSGGTGSTGGGGGTCSNHFMYRGIKVCEDFLPPYGFFWWNGTDGEGWYNSDQFNTYVDKVAKMKGLSGAELLALWAADTLDPSNTNYASSMNNLKQYYTGGGHLPAA